MTLISPDLQSTPIQAPQTIASNEGITDAEASTDGGTPSMPKSGSPSSSPSDSPESASYVKLAMRNMVRKRGKSLSHFFLTTIALLGVLVGLSYLTR